MHIVIDGRIINSSTGRYVERLVTYLQEVDTVNDYTVLVPSKDKDFWKPTAKNFRVEVADFANYSFAEQIGFKKLLDSLQPDLVHFCMPQQPILYKGKVVTTIHDLTLLETYMSDKNWLVYKTKQFIGRFVFHAVIKKSRQIITDTRYTKKKLARFDRRSSGKTTAIHLSADTNRAAIEPYELPFKDYLLYVGQQADYKNIRRLMDAHHELQKNHPDLGLVLVGREDETVRRNKEYAKRKSYTNVIFTGFVSDGQRDWLYENAKTYVFPSLMEGFGLPGLEAIGYGTPVVSSNASCLPEVYESAAHYFDPTNVTDMARAVEEVITNDALRQDLIKKGHVQLKKFSWKKTAEQTFEVYQKALKVKDKD